MGAPRRTDFDPDNLVRRYLSGESVKKLAADHGFSRQVVYRVLRDYGITPRNRSEAMYVRMGSTSVDERKRLTEKAHIARRAQGATIEETAKKAQTRSRRIGKYEREFIEALESEGVKTDPQEPFLTYNLDIGCGPVAVEVHTQTGSPLISKHCRKIMECLEAGKSMVYVWIGRGVPTPACYEKVVSLVKSIRSNPPSRAQYWVVRGTGEVYATGCVNGDGLSSV